jgi:hypothetical protein
MNDAQKPLLAKAPKYKVAGHTCILMNAYGPAVICLVPLTAIRIEDGAITVDHASYLRMRFARRNCQLNEHAAGSHLFPRDGTLPLNGRSAGARELVRDAVRLWGS